jgi:succinylglutamate desuccinylase
MMGVEIRTSSPPYFFEIMKKNNKEILIAVATHGNERIGVEVVKNLVEQKLDRFFDFLIANPKALKKNTRFIDSDLNRSYPGNDKSDKYEEKLAAKNIKIAKRYKYVIDLHEARLGTKNFIIIPRNKFDKSFPLDFINLDTILLWPDPKGTLGSCLKNTIELEFGMKGKNRVLVINKAVRIVKEFICSLLELDDFKKIKARKKKMFKVYGKVNLQDAKKYNLKYQDFKKIRMSKEKFYPLLVNQYRDIGIAFYKMKKVSR